MTKNIYFYWGNDIMSYMRYMTLYSFCLFNPHWKVFLIKNSLPTNRSMNVISIEKQDKTEYSGKDYSKLIGDLNIEIINFVPEMIDLDKKVVDSMSDVHIKDVLNWKLLSEKGGLVSDMDILFTKPITNEISDVAEVGLVCFTGHPLKDYIPVSFMYGNAPNIFFEKVYRNALKNYDPKIYQCCGTLCIEEKNINEIKMNFPDLKIQRFFDGIVFPFTRYPWGQGVDMLYEGDNVDKMNKDSIGIHWYGGAPISQISNNKINDQTLDKINNTITSTIRRILCQSRNNL